MGSGASNSSQGGATTADIVKHVSALGPEYDHYKHRFIQNKTTGQVIMSMNEAEFYDYLDKIGILNHDHKKAISSHLKKKLSEGKSLPSISASTRTFAAYISYENGKNANGYDNFDIAKKIQGHLIGQGISVYVAEKDKNRELNRDFVTRNLDASKCLIVLLTAGYLAKTDDKHVDSNCRLEFEYGLEKYGSTHVLPVFLESTLMMDDAWICKQHNTKESFNLYRLSDGKAVEEQCLSLGARVKELVAISAANINKVTYSPVPSPRESVAASRQSSNHSQHDGGGSKRPVRGAPTKTPPNGATNIVSVGLLQKANSFTRSFINIIDHDNDVVALERDILKEFYKSCNGAQWRKAMNWCTNAPVSDWYGVVVDAQTQLVIEINLSDNNIDGLLPEGFNQLKSIEKIDLSNNKISGKLCVIHVYIYTISLPFLLPFTH